MKVLCVKNWERFQHYKDRDPPWVKLYRDLLTSESWVLGTDLSRVVQVASTLLAPRYENKIPYRFDLLKKVMSLECTEVTFRKAIDHLVEANFLSIQEVTEGRKGVEQSASTMLATCTSETEQSRAETEQIQRGADAPLHTPSSESKKRPSRRCPSDFVVTDDLQVWASTECPGLNVERETKSFRDYEFRNAHTDWPATWRMWMRKAHENRTRRNGSHGPEMPTRRHKEFGQ